MILGHHRQPIIRCRLTVQHSSSPDRSCLKFKSKFNLIIFAFFCFLFGKREPISTRNIFGHTRCERHDVRERPAGYVVNRKKLINIFFQNENVSVWISNWETKWELEKKKTSPSVWWVGTQKRAVKSVNSCKNTIPNNTRDTSGLKYIFKATTVVCRWLVRKPDRNLLVGKWP